ncbi:MAG: thioredoxin family protein [Patescibacteria group bacterium]|nr:thioredoxin family protein [Patescibacteria group bacterium]
MKILKFGAVWCTECIVMKPMWEEIEKELPELKTEYYDADENAELIKKYNITNLPVFIFLDKDDNEFLRLKGAQNKKDLLKIVKEKLYE